MIEPILFDLNGANLSPHVLDEFLFAVLLPKREKAFHPVIWSKDQRRFETFHHFSQTLKPVSIANNQDTYIYSAYRGIEIRCNPNQEATFVDVRDGDGTLLGSIKNVGRIP